jgi:hypothetical protein
MYSVGKLFAIAAILTLVLGFARWPSGTGVYSINFKNRGYGFGPDFWAFTVGAIFAVLAAVYLWFPRRFLAYSEWPIQSYSFLAERNYRVWVLGPRTRHHGIQRGSTCDSA